jgi:hypothetical protein
LSGRWHRNKQKRQQGGANKKSYERKSLHAVPGGANLGEPSHGRTSPPWQQQKKIMAEQPLDRSRRALMHAAVGVVSAGLLFRSQADASDKMTRQQAQYQDTPNGIYSCGLCTLFERPNACKVVEGEVSRDGWCKAFALAD